MPVVLAAPAALAAEARGRQSRQPVMGRSSTTALAYSAPLTPHSPTSTASHSPTRPAREQAAPGDLHETCPTYTPHSQMNGLPLLAPPGASGLSAWGVPSTWQEQPQQGRTAWVARWRGRHLSPELPPASPPPHLTPALLHFPPLICGLDHVS